MTKRTAYTLAWSAASRSYALYSRDHVLQFALDMDSPAWQEWLDQRPHVVSFAFHGQRGAFTARKEQVKPGSWYWYAYQRSQRRLRKKYLGKCEALAPWRLEAIAASFREEPAAPAEPGTDRTSTAGLPPTAPAPPASSDTPERERILAARLRIPPLPPRHVPRPLALARLEGALERPVTIVSAPVGSGKSTLLSSWARRRSVPLAWVALESSDNDPTRYWSAVFSALDSLYPGVGAHTRALLASLGAHHAERVLTLLINLLGDGCPASAGESGDTALVLDDYHTIATESIHQAMMFLIERLPPHLHLVISTRNEPPLPLARLRAHDQLLDIRESDLRFHHEEIIALLAQYEIDSLAPADVALLEQRTVGWAAGLHLVARVLQAQPQRSDIVRGISGSQSSIAEYLGQETLVHLPKETQSFLLRTSILDQLEGSLCEAVSGQPDGAAMLGRLVQSNLFLTPLDESRRWYRYHPFFATLLRQQLQREAASEVPELHRRAARWYGERGMHAEAVAQAREAGDWDSIVTLLEEQGMELLSRGEIQQVMGWVLALPRPLVFARLRIFLFDCWWRWYMGQAAVVVEMLREYSRLHALPDLEIEDVDALERAIVAHVDALYPRPRWSAEQRANRIAEALALYGALSMSRGDGAAFSHAVCRRAVAHVAGLAHRSRITQHLSNVALLRGDLAEATATMEEGLASGIADGSATWVTSIGYRLGMLYQAMGQLPEVTRVARAILRHTQDKPFFTQGAAYIFLGSVEYERNHLEAAEEAYKQAIATCVEADLLREVDPYMHFLIGHLQLAHIKRALGDPAAARAYLEQFAGHLSRRWVGGEVLPVVQGDFALLMRKLGDDQPGRRWLEDFALPAPGEPEPSHELYSLSHLRHLVYVRLALAYQRWQDAWPPLREQQALAERQGRVGSLIEWLILRALLAQAQGDSDEAIAAMARALSLGESSGYVRIFLDEGAAALALVRRVRSELHRGAIPGPDPDPDPDPDPTAQRPSTRYVDQLVADFTRERTRRLARGDTGRGMVEPLTAREREVLALIHDGLSNGEIAGRMVVAPSTVKSHVKAIYAKLGAESRTQALAQARKLNLL